MTLARRRQPPRPSAPEKETMKKRKKDDKPIQWNAQESPAEISIAVLEFYDAVTADSGQSCSYRCPWLRVNYGEDPREAGHVDATILSECPPVQCQWFQPDFNLLITSHGPNDIATIVRPRECKEAEARMRRLRAECRQDDETEAAEAAAASDPPER